MEFLYWEPWQSSGFQIPKLRTVFTNKILLKFCHTHVISMAASMLNGRVETVRPTETAWPAKPEIFAVGPFVENVCQFML